MYDLYYNKPQNFTGSFLYINHIFRWLLNAEIICQKVYCLVLMKTYFFNDTNHNAKELILYINHRHLFLLDVFKIYLKVTKLINIKNFTFL